MNINRMRLLVLSIFVGLVFGQDGPVRDTIYGSVRGSTKTDAEGRTYQEYLGIPFASPPVDELRWEKPIPPESWDGVLDTTEFSVHCTQFIARGYPLVGMSNETSEDCLYLNVYVPGESSEGLSVMYFIYGGAYFLGTSAMYPGYDLALSGDVIVVTVNYRVSTLGWLSTEDEAAEGNYGLWDVQLGLEWVRDNIASFGGDPNSVTVFGQSAGGAMTSHLMVSPPAYGLFQRGISISGGSIGYFGIAQNGALADSTRTLAQLLGCRRLNGSYEVVDCLREKDANTLDFWGVVEVVAFKQQLPNWMPRIDGAIVPVDPWDSWHNGSVPANTDFMSGATHHDAAGFVLLNFLGYRPNATFNFANSEESLNRSITFITNHFPGDTDEMITSIYGEYPLMRDDDLEVRTEATVDATTDWWFRAPAHTELIHHMRAASEGTTSYFYDFRYDQSFIDQPFDFIQGSHIDDLYSVFGEPFMQQFRENVLGNFTEDDKLVHDYITAYYTNFAKTGNPNLGSSEVPVQWDPVSDAATSYLEISPNPVALNETEEMHDKYRFWNHEFEDIAFPPAQKSRYVDIMDRITEEEFEQAVEEAIETIRNYMYDMLADYPAELQETMEFIDQAVEERLATLEDNAE